MRAAGTGGIAPAQQNIASPTVASASLPYDPLTPFLEQDYDIQSLSFQLPGVPSIDPSEIGVTNEVQHYDLKLDVWLTPFLNVFALVGRMEAVNGEVELLAIGNLDQHVADREPVVSLLEEVAKRVEVALGLRHFLGVDHQVRRVHPVAHERLS